MLHQYLILFGSTFAIAGLAIFYAVFCQKESAAKLFLAVIISIIAVWLDFRWGSGMLIQFNTRHYSSTTGEIVHQDITKQYHAGRFGGMRYDVSLTYSYSITNHSFIGNRVRLIDGSCGPSSSSMAKWGHSTGSEVQIFYDPQNPQIACLSVGLNVIDDWLTVIILAGINILPFYFLISAFRTKAKDKT